MHHDHIEALHMVRDLGLRLKADDVAAVDVSVHPPFTDLRTVQTLVEKEAIPIALGAQHCSEADAGARHVLHDRRVPHTRGNIDHIVITAEGVWVIDTKNYKGLAKVSLGVLRRQELTVNGRDKTELASGVRWQMDQVAKALDAAAGGLCRWLTNSAAGVRAGARRARTADRRALRPDRGADQLLPAAARPR